MNHHILAISDEEDQTLPKAYFEQSPYHFMKLQTVAEGLTYLQTMQPRAILLDYSNPTEEKKDFLKKITSEKCYKHIPIIIQTDANTQKKITTNIESGTFYYLIAPFRRSMLLATLDHALNATNYASNNEDGFQENQCVFSFQNLQDIQQIASLSAQLYPSPDEAIVGLKELMLNAVEHGNLGISYHEKTVLKNTGSWEDEINRRLASPKYMSKFAVITIARMQGQIRAVITDQGTGFNWEDYMEISADRTLDKHGRGIALSRLISFDDLSYTALGNQVICTKAV